MIAAIDVAYGPLGAAAACVLFRSFGDAAPAATHVAHIADVAEYEPGRSTSASCRASSRCCKPRRRPWRWW